MNIKKLLMEKEIQRGKNPTCEQSTEGKQKDNLA